MNILFITENELSQQLGGTDRITITLANEFIRRGNDCYLAFCRKSDHPDRCGFKETLLLQDGQESEQLTDFLQIASVDIVMCNLVDINYKRKVLPAVYGASRGTKTKVVACYHAMPGEDLLGNRVGNSLYRIKNSGNFKRNMKDIALAVAPKGMVKSLFGKKILDKYRLMYNYSDALVLHTPEACTEYAKIAELPYDEKFAYVHNALSYDTFIDEADIDKKGKEVLIVARMDEKSKRLSFALKVWQMINDSGKFDDWHLSIVGGGPDLNWYIKMAERLELENVTFEGRVADVTEYYRKASIFMLTSSFEGWALTITEAQQFGVVPVALDSYVSLPTLIDNHKTGVIVPNDDYHGFANEMMWLMSNDIARIKIAQNGLVSCKRFTVDKVVDDWMALFEKLSKEGQE